MVAYGDSLRRARRPGWEDAYLDYEYLRSLLEEIEAITKPRESATWTNEGDEEEARSSRLEHTFMMRLRKEIEKISLFTLTRLGEIAEAVGALRFQDESTRLQIHQPAMQTLAYKSSDDDDDYAPILETESYGEDASLLPSGSIISGPLKTPKPLSTKRAAASERSLFLADQYTQSRDKIGAYTALGVELLHLLRFICVNAMGIRKILKKHDKIAMSTRHPPAPAEIDSSEQKSSHRLVGGPEDHLQQLANSASVAAVHSSLLAAVVNYQAMDAQELMNVSSNEGLLKPIDGYPVPLIRFECTVSSIHTLRQYAQMVNDSYSVFLSRKAMIVTGRGVADIDGATRKALNLLLRFQPDSLLTLNDKALIEWQDHVLARDSGKFFHEAKIKDLAMDDEEAVDSWGGVNSASLMINLMSTLLYTVNYYIVAPTANNYAILLGTDGAFGATLVGASSFAALFAAFLYSFWYTKSSFRSSLLFSALCPCVGNLLYALAISYESMVVAIWGRILVGFGSAEVVNRQLISSCVSFEAMTKASALFVAAGAIGMSLGPLLAAILDFLAGRDTLVDLPLPMMPSGGIIYNHVTSPGFVMTGLWLLEMLALVFLFEEPRRINTGDIQQKEKGLTSLESELELGTTEYGTVRVSNTREAGAEPSTTGSWKTVWSQMVMVNKLIVANMALPVTLLLFGYIELVCEVIISSCSMVCRRYFGWHGSRAGLLIASLGALVLPAHFVVERTSRRYEERTIMKYAIVFILASLLAILNYEGLIFDAFGLAAEAVAPTSNVTNDGVDISIGGTKISSFLNKRNEVPYNWGLGNVGYILFLSAVFMGTIVLEGVDTSIMAKVTPSKLNDTFVNSGLLATLVGTLGRVCGDSMITISALRDKNIFTDFVNATFFPMIPLALIGYYLVKRYYKLLV